MTPESKRSIKEKFKGNAVFRTIDAAYKEQETQMATLRFSPEEIWVNCFIGSCSNITLPLMYLNTSGPNTI